MWRREILGHGDGKVVDIKVMPFYCRNCKVSLQKTQQDIRNVFFYPMRRCRDRRLGYLIKIQDGRPTNVLMSEGLFRHLKRLMPVQLYTAGPLPKMITNYIMTYLSYFRRVSVKQASVHSCSHAYISVVANCSKIVSR